MNYVPEGLRTIDDAQQTPVQPSAGIGARGWLRWAWRQLTSMRVALLLLMLLALAALPGAFIPQVPQDPGGVATLRADRPELAAWFERLGLFDIYAAPWFAAIYLLLFISLIGCILPRTKAHVAALRAAPSRVPRRLARFPVHDTHTTRASPEEVTQAVRRTLRRRFRVAVTHEGISAERGYLRETGNLTFHLSLIGVLVALGAAQMLAYRGQAVVVEGRTFANALVDYDTFTPGTLVTGSDLEAFTFTLTELTSRFTVDAQPRDFAARVEVTEPDGDRYEDTIRVNYPINAAGANIYLAGNGFAPHLTVRDAQGQVAFSQPVPFLPEDDFYTSRGVLKVPDVSPGLDQLGFTGYLLPSAVVDGLGARSVHPQPNAPLLVLDIYTGDLGLDEGVPQNVYELATEDMTQVMDGEEEAKVLLEPGQEVQLPDGLGSISFDSLPRFAAIDLRYDPTLTLLLVSSLAAMAGLAASLFVPRRRLWVKITQDDTGGTVVEAAALARGDDPGLERELERVMTEVRATGPSPQEDT
ncbi:cytochrome c biogenesis protein [Georgenia satyanarayanai]|uniref:Cytochrome c biogenesis protein n=1 Tax=Georgenia satyanarayanai TaxID=860221 RepID=A0A2Y9AS37_9MICO|nr:cytochrome c biogenesis protein ResB [Georgenia satyanarayanai]PYF96355.1 cytochrome c biogenesis protein [Georgenia satyanarayanai]SSA46886.1 cytochrome c biogenesis protein [Georgenia satyanarayanai]